MRATVISSPPPAGCGGTSAAPTCPAATGGTDALTLAWASTASYVGTLSNYRYGYAERANATATRAAMYYCRNLNYGGHTDWYLPKELELVALYTSMTEIGGFASATYWSASEASSAGPLMLDMATGYMRAYTPTSALNVRCVRRN